ncbi:MAG: transcription termination factor NusA [Candidatus Gribaldobacteria bacterium]|nr:transcription termination factor NusA [Candidatus Gribaldobacteria bacterium]
MDLKSFASAITEIAEERNIPEDKLYEIIAEAIASAYKKEYGKKKQKITASLENKTGELLFWQIKQVVTPEMLLTEEEIQELKDKRMQGEQRTISDDELETVEGEEKKIRFNPERHILLVEAREIEPEIKVGEELKIPLETKDDFGRIAAQTAKQVILQKIREVEKEEAYKEFSDREGEVVSGIVQRVEKNAIFFDIGRASGILPYKEQIYGETYRPSQRLKLFVLKTEVTPKGPLVVLSRIYPKLISKLFELEVPEIGAKQVIVRAIAREAGSRSKVAVSAEEDGIDPIGALVGQRGSRITAVINELGGEKIDVILWDEKPEKFLANALSPAKVLEVRVLPRNRAQVIIPDDQLSLAIGKEGQNVRLAAKLTGWKIDVRSLAQFEEDKKEGRLPFSEEEEIANAEALKDSDTGSVEVEVDAKEPELQ